MLISLSMEPQHPRHAAHADAVPIGDVLSKLTGLIAQDDLVPVVLT